MLAAPGADWQYNQLGYLLAGLVVRGATNQRFDAYCRRRIFEPLGLGTAVFGGRDTAVPGRATYYEFDGAGALGVYTGGLYPFAGVAPAAGLNLTARELARFDAALTRGELLEPGALETMWAPARLSSGKEARYRTGTMGYACGWTLIHYSGHTARGHDGGHTNAYFRFEPDGLTVIVLTNLVDRDGPPLCGCSSASPRSIFLASRTHVRSWDASTRRSRRANTSSHPSSAAPSSLPFRTTQSSTTTSPGGSSRVTRAKRVTWTSRSTPRGPPWQPTKRTQQR